MVDVNGWQHPGRRWTERRADTRDCRRATELSDELSPASVVEWCVDCFEQEPLSDMYLSENGAVCVDCHQAQPPPEISLSRRLRDFGDAVFALAPGGALLLILLYWAQYTSLGVMNFPIFFG